MSTAVKFPYRYKRIDEGVIPDPSVRLEILTENGWRKTRFLVDSGATYTVVPQKLVRKLNLKPSFEQEFTLAGGKVVKRKVGNALVEFQGRETTSPVVLGKEKDSPLLGILTLEALGLALDPFQRKLYKARLML